MSLMRHAFDKLKFFSHSKVLLGALLLITYIYGGAFIVHSEAEADELIHKLKASRFLHATTFGPKMSEIEDLAEEIGLVGEYRAFQRWLNRQYRMNQVTTMTETATNMIIGDFGTTKVSNELLKSKHGGYYRRMNGSSYRKFAWWDNLVKAKDQLRQKMAWALHQIFVVSDRAKSSNFSTLRWGAWYGLAQYYDLFTHRAFGSYRALLEDLTYQPHMGWYLSFAGNQKANPAKGTSPDENYAREIMQLFSIGLYERNMSGTYKTNKNGGLKETYTAEDVSELARVFTGLNYQDKWDPLRVKPYRYRQHPHGGSRLLEKLQPYEFAHDTGRKMILGKEIESGLNISNDISRALDIIVDNNNVAPFMSKLLIQRLVTSNPSKKYVAHVAKRFNHDPRSGKKKSFRTLLAAIFLNQEFRKSIRFEKRKKNEMEWEVTLKDPIVTTANKQSKLREPILQLANLVRVFFKESDATNANNQVRLKADYGAQNVFGQPSVFGFYSPEFLPHGQMKSKNLTGPEFQILTYPNVSDNGNKINSVIKNGYITDDVFKNKFDYDPFLFKDGEYRSIYNVIKDLDILFCYGRLTASGERAIIERHVLAFEGSIEDKFKLALMLIFNSPSYAIYR